MDVSDFIPQVNQSGNFAFLTPNTSGVGFGDGNIARDTFSNAIDFNNALPFGSNGAFVPADSSTGDIFELQAAAGFLALPEDYISGTIIGGTITFDNSTFASLGVTPGTYTYNLTNNIPNNDIILDIGVTPVPFEFSPVVGVSLLGGLWLGRKALKRKKSK